LVVMVALVSIVLPGRTAKDGSAVGPAPWQRPWEPAVSRSVGLAALGERWRARPAGAGVAAGVAVTLCAASALWTLTQLPSPPPLPQAPANPWRDGVLVLDDVLREMVGR